jgi:hypothetical protein
MTDCLLPSQFNSRYIADDRLNTYNRRRSRSIGGSFPCKPIQCARFAVTVATAPRPIFTRKKEHIDAIFRIRACLSILILFKQFKPRKHFSQAVQSR